MNPSVQRLVVGALGLLLAAGCTLLEAKTINGKRWGYVRTDGTIRYQQPPNNGFFPGTAGVQYDMPAGVDADTFVLVADGWPEWAKDRQRVYYRDGVLPGADAAMFVQIGQSPYATDRRSVWFFGEELAGVDPSTFRIVTHPDDSHGWYDWFVADRSAAWFRASRLENVDAPGLRETGDHVTDGASCWSLNGKPVKCPTREDKQ